MSDKSATPSPDGIPGKRLGTLLPRMAVLLCWVLLASAGCGTSGSAVPPSITVDSLADADPPPDGTTTLRAAIRQIGSGGTIAFAPSLNGETIPDRKSVV